MQLNPTKADIEEFATQYEGKGADDVKPMLNDVIGEIEAVHDQLSANYDWSKVTKLDGTSDDKRNAFRKMNARMCALRDRMRDIKAIEHSRGETDHAAEIAERNGGSRPSDPRDRAEAERMSRIAPSDLERYNSTRFLRMAAEQSGISLEGEGHGKQSICYQIANRVNGVDKLSIPLDFLIGPRHPLNVLTGGGPASGGATGGGQTVGAGGGWSIYPPMTDLVVDAIWQPTMIMDLVRRLTTRSNLYVYRKNTTTVPQIPIAGATPGDTNTRESGWVPENTAGVEISPKWETQTSPVVKCLAYAEVTEEQIEDGEDVDALIAEQLRRELRNQVEVELMLGTGIHGRMQGIFGSGTVGTEALAAPTVGATGAVNYGFDLLSKAHMQILKDTWMMPDRFVMDPLDFHSLSTTRGSDGHLQFMDPTEAAAKRVLGLPVVFSPYMNRAMTPGTVGIGAFSTAAALVDRRDVQLSRTDAHDANFTKDVITIKASVRVAGLKFYEKAFRTVTNFSGVSTPKA